MNDLEDENALRTEEIFPRLGTVMRPTEHRGEGKEEHGNGNELGTEAEAEIKNGIEGTAYQSSIGVALGNFAGQHVEGAACQAA